MFIQIINARSTSSALIEAVSSPPALVIGTGTPRQPLKVAPIAYDGYDTAGYNTESRLGVRSFNHCGVAMERRPTKHVPLVGDVAAGVNVLAHENVEELIPLPMDFTGDGDLFMLRVRGESMIGAGILDGDYVVCRQQATADNGDVVIAGIPGDEATIKTFSRKGNAITLTPSNPAMEPMVFDAGEVTVFGKLVTVLRRL